MRHMDVDTLARTLAEARRLPVLRAADPDSALERAADLIATGAPVIEVTTTIPGWTDAIAELRSTAPDTVLGAGTVLTATHARAAATAGAAFCVSPCPAPQARHSCAELGMPFIEGGFTPLEVSDAALRGIAKLFPAHVGGVAYLRSILSVWPEARIVVTGGIAADDVDRWLEAGALAVGLGRGLPAAGDR
jgi:2-dehydro-3-deoxyphosphogluconate aldolase / (4S)-4-hydroxy-2-oxoglutarate aldolase